MGTPVWEPCAVYLNRSLFPSKCDCLRQKHGTNHPAALQSTDHAAALRARPERRPHGRIGRYADGVFRAADGYGPVKITGESRVSEFPVITPETDKLLILLFIYGGGGQDRTADLRVMKTPISNTINYLRVVQDRQNTPKYV